MKQIFIPLMCLTVLGGCESVSMPSLSSLNPFDSSDSEVQSPAQTTVAPSQDADAMSTEMAEMQRVMGSVPTFNTQPAPAPMIEEPVMEMAEPTPPMPEVTPQESAIVATTEKSAPTPTAKPQSQLAQINPPVEEVIEETVTNTADKMVGTSTPPAPAPVAMAEPAAPAPAVTEPAKPQMNSAAVYNNLAAKAAQAQASAPTLTPQVQDIQEVVAQPTSVQQTDDTAMYDEQDLKLSSAEGCPKVRIMPSGRSITYFENELSGQLVARAVINEVRGGCEVVSGGLEIDLDILMKGRITDKGRFEGNRDMESFMTFPYFVAVTSPQGLPVDKKILATAMRFKPVVNDLDHAEKITQFIPMDNPREAANYTITIGYQLNRKQLEYNRARNIKQSDSLRAAPGLRNRSRLSLDPLAD